MLTRSVLFGLFIVLAACLVVGMLAVPSRPALAEPVTVPPAPPPPSDSATATIANPAVEPGKVHWHKTTEAALAAAKKSNKPLLVFHMMGQLDHQFC